MLQLKSVSYQYQNKQVLQELSCQITENKITAVIGPNGAGKSTLLKLMAKLLTPKTGQIRLQDKDITNIKHKKFAKSLSFLMQNPTTPESFTVEQLIMLGRYPYLGLFGKPSKKDQIIVDKALSQVSLTPLKHIQLTELSGGQQQRAWIAMAIAQDTPYILLDEPTSFLDLSYKLDLLNLLQQLRDKHNKTIVMVIHDLNLASYYADEIIVLKNGKLIKQGGTCTVLNEELMRKVFAVNTKLHVCEAKKTRTFVPY